MLGNVHDLECYFGIDNSLSVFTSIFICHWGHLAIILLWLSGNLFHISWNGNYELWVLNPVLVIPV